MSEILPEGSEKELPEVSEEELSEVPQEETDMLPDTADDEENVPQPTETDGYILNAADANDFTIADGVLTKYTGSETQVVIPGGVKKIADNVFQDKKTIESVQLPNGLTEIGNNAFKDCTSLKGIDFPSTIQTIGNFAFLGVNFGEKKIDIVPGTLTIPGSVTSIGQDAFYGCAYLGEVVFEEGDDLLEIASSEAYPSCNTFGSCPELTKVTLPKRLRKINTSTFSGNGKLEQVVFSEGLTEIGVKAFQNCAALKEAVFPGTLETIGNDAFNNCTAMQRAVFPNTLKTIGNFAFSGVNFGEKKIDIVPGTLTIPGSVTSIGQGAFYGCAYLGEVVFEEGDDLLEIASSEAYPSCNTFGNCPELTLVSLPERVREIQRCTFSDDPKLEILCIPAAVTTIHENAVNNCPKVVIYGTKNSPAETYANSKKIPFKDINELDFSVTGVSVIPESIVRTGEKAIGEQIQLQAVVLPAIARNKKVTWQSDHEGVASVDDQGLVTLTGYGTAQITVTTEEGQKTASCLVTVQEQGQEDSYTVSFDLQECGSDIPDYTGVRPGSTINEPAAPQAAGYVFIGWYQDADCTEPWNFSKDTVDEDLTLYAGWEIDDTYDGILADDLSAPEKQPSRVWVTGIKKEVVYTGQVITQRVRVYDGSRRLEEGLEYTVSYKNNKNASGTKTPTVTVTGKGNYKTFKQSYTFSIKPVDIRSAKNILAEDVVTVYTGKKQNKMIPTVTYNGKKLSNKKDFTVSYDGPGTYTETGTYPVTITGKGNFTGTLKVNLKIIEGTPMSKVKVSKISAQDYNDGKPVELKERDLKVKVGKAPLVLGTDYTIAYENNRKIGTATAVITGIESRGYVGTKRITFKITGTALSKTKVTGISPCIYNGRSQKQAGMKIQRKSTGELLKENEDYHVSYSRNKNAGKATITITGIGRYSGVVKKTFKIQACNLKEEASRLGGLEKITGTYDADGKLEPKPELTFDERKLIPGRDYTLSYRNNNKSSKREPQIIIKGKGNFKGTVTRPITVQE